MVLLQATRIQLALANGTLADFTPQSQPHLWKAVQVSRISDVWHSDGLATDLKILHHDCAITASGRCGMICRPAKGAW